MTRSRLIAMFNIWSGKLWQFSVKDLVDIHVSAKHCVFDKIIFMSKRTFLPLWFVWFVLFCFIFFKLLKIPEERCNIRNRSAAEIKWERHDETTLMMAVPLFALSTAHVKARNKSSPLAVSPPALSPPATASVVPSLTCNHCWALLSVPKAAFRPPV